MPGTPKIVSPASVRVILPFRIPLVGFLDQAGAVTWILSMALGYHLHFEKMLYVPDVAPAGAGASQAIRLRKGNATGTIIDTVTPTLANAVLNAAGVASTGVSAANELAAKIRPADTFSITKDAGTVFSAGGGTLWLIGREHPQSRGA